MMKLGRPKKFALFTTVSNSLVEDSNVIDAIKKELKPTDKDMPKNTLKAKFINFEAGMNGDDIFYDRFTIKANYLIYTFKRR